MFKGFIQYLCCCHFAGIPKKYESFQRFYGEKKIKTFRFPKWEIIICLFGNGALTCKNDKRLQRSLHPHPLTVRLR